MKPTRGYPRKALCRCGNRLIPVGLPGTCWVHEETEMAQCKDGEWAIAKKVTEEGWRKVRRAHNLTNPT